MYSKSYDRAFSETISIEGGFKCETQDRMDWTGGQVGKGKLVGTKFGISAGTYPTEDIRNLTRERAKELYHRDFWMKSQCEQMPLELAGQVFDADVNHGLGMGVRFLQKAMGITPDGVVGPKTLAEVQKWWDVEAKLILRFLAHRMWFFTQIKTWDSYGRGWANRVAQKMIDATEE